MYRNSRENKTSYFPQYTNLYYKLLINNFPPSHCCIITVCFNPLRHNSNQHQNSSYNFERHRNLGSDQLRRVSSNADLFRYRFNMIKLNILVENNCIKREKKKNELQPLPIVRLPVNPIVIEIKSKTFATLIRCSVKLRS